MDFNSSNMMTTMARSNSVAASSLRTYRTSNSSSSGGGGMSVNHLTTTTTLQEQQEKNTNYWEIEQSAKTTGDLTEDAAKSEAHDDFNSTQRLRSGFFRSIKRQYPSVQLNGSLIPSDNEESKLKVSGSLQEEPLRVSPQPLHDANPSSSSFSSALSPAEEDSSSSFISMKRSARRKLNQLRKCDPKQVDIQTGLQWIRLELNEMREQDKSIFLQLAKVYSNLKELKSELKQKNDDEDFEYSCEDFYQLPAWWHGKSTETKISTPHISTTVATAARFNTNSSRSLLNNEHGKLTNFSASDSAQFVRTLSVQNHRRPRRGRSPLPIPLPSTPPVFNF